MSIVLLVVGTVASYLAGWAIDRPLLVPLLNTAASYPFMLFALRRGQLGIAVVRMLVWALALGVCSTVLSYAQPLRTDLLFIRGASYRAEMFAWVMTGRGAESTPAIFVPQQLEHAALFVVLALASAGAVAMLMGAVLMNYMGHYVGMLAAASTHPGVTMVLAWVPWAVIRVVSFVALGVTLSVPLLARAGLTPLRLRDGSRFVTWALGGLLADIVLKALLAPTWQRMLLRVVGW